ncbi:FG-GAP-like repeat-containing protein [Pontibacter silvestris]|nr:T9SS type A sorting domain-containing protein [Pontibacter silvestris]
MKKLLTLITILLAVRVCVAQERLQFRLRTDVPVMASDGELASPWSGGLNTPQFSTIDLNKDGQQDLFAFDRMLRKVYTWLAVQESGTWSYKYVPEYEVFFPADLDAWVLLRDYNCDGLKDIFTSSPLGIRVFKQEAAAQGQLKFTESKSFLTYNTNEVNLQMNAADVPSIVDMDGDGDLDVLIAEFSAGYNLEYYRNVQAEDGLECGSLTFVKASNWWGGITECEGCNNFRFGTTCSDMGNGRVAAPLHSGHDGSSILLLDLNADGDKDLIMGGVQCENLVLMENHGDRNTALMTGFEQGFPAEKPATFNYFPSAYYEDVTFDGVPDMLVAPSVTQDLLNINLEQSVWLYENKGMENQPDFQFVQDDFLQSQMIDVGESAYPAFADLNGDGLLDMLVGNEVTFRDGLYSASISYYQNTGTATAPAFTLVTDDYLNLSQRQLRSLKPAFADINADGALDLVLTYRGQSAGTNQIYYIPNQVAANQPAAFDFSAAQTLLKVTDGDTPAFFDADQDGDLDMVLGKANGTLQFYRNAGSATQPKYELVKNNVGGINSSYDLQNIYPVVVDVDGDNQPDLLTVDDSGKLRIYRDFSKNLDDNFTAEGEDVLENTLTNQLQTTRFGRGLSIAVAPLGGQNKLYAVVGARGGGLYLLEQVAGYVENSGEENQKPGLVVFPNPADKNIRESICVEADALVRLDVYGVTGRKIYSTGEQYVSNYNIPLHHFAAGLYMLRATSQAGEHTTVKFIVR